MPILRVGDSVRLTGGGGSELYDVTRVNDQNEVTEVYCHRDRRHYECRVSFNNFALMHRSLTDPEDIKKAVCTKVILMDERFRKRHLTRAQEQCKAYRACLSQERQRLSLRSIQEIINEYAAMASF